MSRFLIALQEGGGDSPPFVFIARGLVAAGHEVTALADPVLRPDVEAAGAVFRSWRAAPHKETYSPDENLARDWEARTPLGKFKRFRDGIAFGPSSGYARDVLEESQRLRPDVVLATTVGFGAQAGAEAAGVPLVVAMTTCYLVPGTGAAPYASGLGPPRSAPQRFRQALLDPVAQRLWATGLPPLNAARREIGLDPVTTPFEQLHRAARFLVLTSRPSTSRSHGFLTTCATSARDSTRPTGPAPARRPPAKNLWSSSG